MNKYIIKSKSSVKDALTSIEKNNMGIVFVEENKKIIGAITDGDIRRALLKNINIDDLINTLINKDFVFLFEKDATKENILKLLDNRIRVIPILNNEYNFVTIVSKDNISWNEEEVLISKSRSPLRISFAGGGDRSHIIFL